MYYFELAVCFDWLTRSQRQSDVLVTAERAGWLLCAYG